MTGWSVNVGEIMLGEMACTQFGWKIKRYFYGNILIQYMLFRDLPEYPGYDEVVEAPRGLMDIMTLLYTTSKLTPVARNGHEKNFSRYIFSSMNLMMSRIGVIDGERAQLRTELSGASNEMLGITFGSPIHP